MMHYKGFTAKVEYDEASGLFYGRVVGRDDGRSSGSAGASFKGDDVQTFLTAFRDTVEALLTRPGRRPGLERRKSAHRRRQ